MFYVCFTVKWEKNTCKTGVKPVPKIKYRIITHFILKKTGIMKRDWKLLNLKRSGWTLNEDNQLQK